MTELEAERAGMERQAENDADVTAERVRAAGQRITDLQGDHGLAHTSCNCVYFCLTALERVCVCDVYGLACASSVDLIVWRTNQNNASYTTHKLL